MDSHPEVTGLGQPRNFLHGFLQSEVHAERNTQIVLPSSAVEPWEDLGATRAEVEWRELCRHVIDFEWANGQAVQDRDIHAAAQRVGECILRAPELRMCGTRLDRHAARDYRIHGNRRIRYRETSCVVDAADEEMSEGLELVGFEIRDPRPK